MAEPRKDALLQLPWIVFDGLEHVATVIRFNDYRRASAQSLGNQGGDVTKVHHGGDFHAAVSGRETKIVHGVVGYREWMKVDVADAKVRAGIDFDYAIAQRVGAPAGLVGRLVAPFGHRSLARVCLPSNGASEGLPQDS